MALSVLVLCPCSKTHMKPWKKPTVSGFIRFLEEDCLPVWSMPSGYVGLFHTEGGRRPCYFFLRIPLFRTGQCQIAERDAQIAELTRQLAEA